MNKNTRFQILFSSLVAASLVLFMSCGHQRTKENDGLFADMDRERNLDSQEVNVPVEGEQKAEVSSDLTAPANETKPEVAPMEELTSSKNVDPTTLDEAAKTEEHSREAPKSDLHAASSLDSAPPTAESMPPMEAPTEALVEAKPEQKLEGPSALLPPVDEKMADSLAQMTVPTADSAEVAAAEPAQTEAAPKKVRRARKGGVKVPEIPTESVWKKGHTLNRYYFLRPNDTAEKVSEMVYGNASRAEDLKSWNQGDWKTGRIVMFPSAKSQEDTAMKSIYEEREVPAQAYTVKDGEKLSEIAAATYGDPKAWIEIAAMNHLKSEKVTGGTTLNLYPTELSVYTPAEPETQVAKVEEKPEVKADVTSQVAVNEVAKQEPVTAPAPKKVVKKAKLANAQVGGVFEEHLAAIFGAGLILMASFFAFRYFRRNRELQD